MVASSPRSSPYNSLGYKKAFYLYVRLNCGSPQRLGSERGERVSDRGQSSALGGQDCFERECFFTKGSILNFHD